METQSKTTKIILFIITNIILLTALYIIPTDSSILENLCIYKLILGKECWNCGMPRAFLALLHLDFNTALNYNNKVVIVFPMAIVIYLNTWYKYIKKGQEQN